MVEPYRTPPPPDRMPPGVHHFEADLNDIEVIIRCGVVTYDKTFMGDRLSTHGGHPHVLVDGESREVFIVDGVANLCSGRQRLAEFILNSRHGRFMMIDADVFVPWDQVTLIKVVKETKNPVSFFYTKRRQ